MLGIEAEFISLEGRHPVTLQDLSASGAKMQVARGRPTASGILRWMDLEVFGEIKWQRGEWCGIVFDRPISNACLVRTRRAAPGLLAAERRNATNHARDFVNGQ